MTRRAKTPAARPARAKRRPWVRILLVFLIALLVWMYFSGFLPKFGSEPGENRGQPESGARIVTTNLPIDAEIERGDSEVAASGGPVVGDTEQGRRVRLEYLLESGALSDARALATTMSGAVTNEEQRSFVDKYLGGEGLLAQAAATQLDAAMEAEDFPKAEASWEELRSLGAETLLTQRALHAAAGVSTTRLSAAWEDLAKRIESALPIELDADAGVESALRIEGDALVVRTKGTAGGFRFHNRKSDELDPIRLRAAFVARFADDGRLDALARLFDAAARPLAARYVRRGKLGR